MTAKQRRQIMDLVVMVVNDNADWESHEEATRIRAYREEVVNRYRSIKRTGMGESEAYHQAKVEVADDLVQEEIRNIASDPDDEEEAMREVSG